MLGLGSIQSSKWAFDYLKSTNSFNSDVTITNGSSSFSLWNTPTVGPDGFVYMLPCADTATVSGVANSGLTGILVISPGNSNNGTTSYQAPSSQYLTPGTNRDAIPISTSILGSNIRFASKGILAPNGKIYFIGLSQKGVVILTPNGFNSTWTYKTFTQMLGATVPAQVSFSGGVLGQDGKIYLIPTGIATARIDPSTDTMSYGYWNGNIGRRWNAGATGENGFGYPRNSSGTIITPPANVPSPNASGQKTFNGLKDAISHPNGNIYMFPYDSTGDSRWIFILDPGNWGTITEIYSSTDLALPNPNPVTSTSGSVFGSCENIFLEKQKTGQNTSNLKIYATYFGDATYYTSSWNDQYPNAKMIVLDPGDNSVTLVGDINNAYANNNYGQAAKPGIQFPNGFIASFRTNSTSSTNNIANVIITGDDGGANNTFPSKSTNVIGSQSELFEFKDFGNSPSASGGFGGSSILINNSFGKIIFSGGKESNGNQLGGIAFSVKGFYPGIKYFDSSGDMYKIPSNLSGLATSLWNSYCNKPF